MKAYRDACQLGTRQRLVMELCVGTSLRIGDVLEMRWSNMQEDRGDLAPKLSLETFFRKSVSLIF